MIHFNRVPEPPDFDQGARQKGKKWINDHPTGRPVDLWSPYKSALADGFRNLCAYSVMYEPVGTVDHYLSCDDPATRDLAYEWSNYRFASGWMNSSKKTSGANVIDPFEVGEDWFCILLPSLQLILNEANIPLDQLERARFTLERLHLRDDERIIRQRREWFRMYQEGELTLEGLEKKAPLIAHAVRMALK
jgi:hypothetical protein